MRPLSFIAGTSIGIVCSSAIALAWTGPTGTAPSNNVAAPINTSASAQLKNGNLGVNGLAVFGDALLQPSAYLNWGITTGSPGYGIHDNAGVLEFKNAGGLWASFNGTIQAFFSGGNTVSQIKFADGTVQTTASGGGSIPDYQVFTASGTWTKPASATMTYIECWGGGGGAYGGLGAGGGGGYFAKWIRTNQLTATVVVTIGAGGAGVVGNGGGGSAYAVAGGNSTFGSYITAQGGGPGGYQYAGSPYYALGGKGGGNGGVQTREYTDQNGSSCNPPPAAPAMSGGSGLTMYCDANPNGSDYGGGGGGCGGIAGGASSYGGAGGSGIGNGTAGAAPGGGGGCNINGGSGSAGARGECRVTTL
jgi:hypothetical protein